jgi:hypothetical protein
MRYMDIVERATLPSGLITECLIRIHNLLYAFDNFNSVMQPTSVDCFYGCYALQSTSSPKAMSK